MGSSLRVRLLAWYSLILVTVIVTFAGVVGYLLWRTMTAEVDARLQASAASLVEALRPAGGGEFDLDLPLEYQPAEGVAAAPAATYYAIWTARGELIDRSPVPFDIPPPSGAGTRTLEGRRELTVLGADDALVLVGSELDDARAAVRTFAATAAVGGVAALLLSLAGGWFLVGGALAPLHTALERLRTALDSQQRFTADASHELRTPLATMLAETEWALARPRTADEYRESLHTSRRASQRMERLVSRLLTLARADHDAAPLERAPMTLGPIVEEVVDLVRPLAVRNGVTIASHIEPATVNGDRERLTELVTNLCANAVEYNRDGGDVRVDVWTEGADACLRVADSGIGIAAEDVPRIFERFYRPGQARDRRSGGAGLGLAIARWIAEAHGGTITCRSRLGEGTEMLVRLPLVAGVDARAYSSDSSRPTSVSSSAATAPTVSG
jgi:signal transduction histidine kinase